MHPLLQKFSTSYQEESEQRGEYWEGTFSEYFEIVRKNPSVVRDAFKRIYDMIMSYGIEKSTEYKEEKIHYKFFDDPDNNGADAVFGLDKPLMVLTDTAQSAARKYGMEKRLWMLHGPVGSSKSTIARLLKKGLESYSRKEAGALYTFFWKQKACASDPDIALALSGGEDLVTCPMHEEPLRLIPSDVRAKILEELGINAVIEGDLCPFCRTIFKQKMLEYKGDFAKLIEENIRVRRLILSEKDRVGIGTFQPKDEKNQDSTELTGDMNYRGIMLLGRDSDARAFNFDGEFNIANRGIVEFVEMLKLDVAFLYDLLGASQEHKVKPKKFAQVDIDEVILGHTNEPEYRKLQNNEFMEALRDRTVKIDVPYVTRLSDEIRIYQKDYNPDKVIGKHIAPHTIEMAAMWAVLTRLEAPKKATLSLIQKLHLYNGKTLPGFTEEIIKELKAESLKEGMSGISPRYVQDKISEALVSHSNERCINPFMVMNQLEEGLGNHSLVTTEHIRKQYIDLIVVAKEEYDIIVKKEVQEAIVDDKTALERLCGNYIDNVKAYTQREKVKNKFTGTYEEPDKRLMRSVEEKIDIPESRQDDFRREVMNYIGACAVEGRVFNYKDNERLLKALQLKLFEDQKDSIRLTALVTGTIDQETQGKIDVVKNRLIKDFGYKDCCATDVLHYVASIFARGEQAKKK